MGSSWSMATCLIFNNRLGLFVRPTVERVAPVCDATLQLPGVSSVSGGGSTVAGNPRFAFQAGLRVSSALSATMRSRSLVVCRGDRKALEKGVTLIQGYSQRQQPCCSLRVAAQPQQPRLLQAAARLQQPCILLAAAQRQQPCSSLWAAAQPQQRHILTLTLVQG
jgi:hypothetical protein